MSSSRAAVAAISLLSPFFLLGESALTLPSATIGSHLQVPAKIRLNEPAPNEGLQITVRSLNPDLLRISAAADKMGAASIIIKARPGNMESQEFWLQALGSSGTATYSAEVPGGGSANGVVTLAPSGIVIKGPYQIPKFPTTTGAVPPKIRFIAARLDSSLKFAEQQAAASDVRLEVSNSNPSAGRLAESPVEIAAGESSALTLFHPAGEGDATFSIKEPPGFSVPAEGATVTAAVRKPGIVISEDLIIGRNLQVGGALALGEFSPIGGLTVTLTSADPSRLLLSPSAAQAGSQSIQIKISEQQIAATYYLQALGDSGEVEYTATGPGFRTRTAVVKLAPSGITLTPYFQGPPDEAQVLKAEMSDGSHGFTMKRSDQTPMKLIVWTAQLDPKTHRSADITVQPLRGGMSLTVSLTNSNPAVGKAPLQVTINGGTDHGTVDFTPLGVGTTEMSIVTPKSFTPSANSTKVTGTITN